jgi:hypothetical protein
MCAPPNASWPAPPRIGVATADLYPSIGIGLSAGSTGFVKDLGLPAANRWSIGGLLHWSIPAPVPAPGSSGRCQRRRRAGPFRWRRARRPARNRNRAGDLCREPRSPRRADEALASARTASDQARRLRGRARAIISDIGGRQGVIGAEAAVLNSRAEIANDQINLFLALGGGW